MSPKKAPTYVFYRCTSCGALTGHTTVVPARCEALIRTTRNAESVMASYAFDRCNGALEQLVLAEPHVLTGRCVTLANGECVSPWACVHGGDMTPSDLLAVMQRLMRDSAATERQQCEELLESMRRSLRTLMRAVKGQHKLTSDELMQARDLADTSGI
jgi:hypothetical protein